MPNSYRGEANVPGLGVLKYDWDAIARLIAEFGQDFDTKVSEAASTTDLNMIAQAVAIGLGGDTTAEDVKRASPPIVPTVTAVMAALNLSFHGKEEAPRVAGGNPPKPNGATSSRKPVKPRSARG